jgi:cellobiose PTS system EIIB component
MDKQYSIAEARHDLAAIVRELEQQPVIRITRRGQPVAVLLSAREFERITAPSVSFWSAYQAFRAQVDLSENGLEANFLENLRQEDRGREITL